MKSTKTTFLKGLRVLTMVGLFGLVLGTFLIPLRQVNAQVVMPAVEIGVSPGTITSGQSALLNWSSIDATSITITPDIGSVPPSGNRTVSPTQTTTYTITGTNSTGGSATTSATLYVTQNQTCQDSSANNYGGTLPCTYTQQPTVTLYANPTSVQYNGTSIVTWNSQNATSCNGNSGTNGWAGNKSTSGSFYTGALTNTTNFGITCTNNAGQQANASVTVNVTQNQVCQDPNATNYGGPLPCVYPQQPTVTLYANPSSITSGQNSTLTWTSTYATSCSAYWTGSTATSGSGVVVPTGTTTYSITCYGTNGQQVSASATVYVNNNNYQTCQDTGANNYGGILPCTYTYYNQTCQDTGANNYRGTLPCTYTYYNQTCQDPSAINYRGTLPCSYPQLQVCQDTNAINYRGTLPCRYYTPIINNQPTVVLYADQASVPYNGAATVRWLTTNATSCFASGGSVGWAGTKSIGPGSFYTGSLTGSRTYTITCNNNFGSATDSVSITVRGQVLGATIVRPAPTSLVLITSSVDRNQPIVPTLDNTRPRPGDEINYTVNYQNIGTGSITGLSLRMDLPYEVDYMFSTPNNPTKSGNTLIFNLGTLKANGQGTVTVRVRVRDNIPAGTNLNFPATLSYIDPSGFPQSVTANVSAQVWSAPVVPVLVVPTPVDTNANIFLGANVFGAGFLPGNLFGWLLLLILILLLVLLAKYLFGQSNVQPFSKRTTTTLDQPLGKKTTTTTVQQQQ